MKPEKTEFFTLEAACKGLGAVAEYLRAPTPVNDSAEYPITIEGIRRAISDAHAEISALQEANGNMSGPVVWAIRADTRVPFEDLEHILDRAEAAAGGRAEFPCCGALADPSDLVPVDHQPCRCGKHEKPQIVKAPSLFGQEVSK